MKVLKVAMELWEDFFFKCVIVTSVPNLSHYVTIIYNLKKIIIAGSTITSSPLQPVLKYVNWPRTFIVHKLGQNI